MNSSSSPEPAMTTSTGMPLATCTNGNTRVARTKDGSGKREVNPAFVISAVNRTGSSGWRAMVISTSALNRGTPCAVTACAPNTYHRPQRDNTGAIAVSSSTAAGGMGATKQLGKTDMAGEIALTVVGTRPLRIDEACLSAELTCDTKPLDCAELDDPLRPVAILIVAKAGPRASHELPNAPRHHRGHCTASGTMRCIGLSLDRLTKNSLSKTRADSGAGAVGGEIAIRVNGSTYVGARRKSASKPTMTSARNKHDQSASFVAAVPVIVGAIAY